jgi:hypothetical protein
MSRVKNRRLCNNIFLKVFVVKILFNYSIDCLAFLKSIAVGEFRKKA